MRALLDLSLRRFVVCGQLSVTWPDGSETTYRGAEPGPTAAMRLTTPEVVRRLVVNPALAVGECYMDQTLVPNSGPYDLIDVLMINLEHENSNHALARLNETFKRLTRRFAQFNPAPRARRNVAHHYDLDGTLYSRFLDADRQYSCAYFPRGDETLDEAQEAKKRHIAAKLRLDRPGLEVLDIGCGWGGMALTLARDHGARVLGITLSTEQLAEARDRAERAGLSDRVQFELLDYRALDRQFDRIVSVGMFEHVGVGHYKTFFETVKRSLRPDGVALLHAIGRQSRPGATNPWIAKYIFPGGYCPALSEVFAAVEKSGLVTTDAEILRLHYAQTLHHWRQRFDAQRAEIAKLYDERFCRMFEFYLAGSEISFRRGGMMIFQIQLARHQEAVPLTRDYMVEAERTAPAATRLAAE
jgi:cyclopropane-fatty-acyl-phospholipid synthase